MQAVIGDALEHKLDWITPKGRGAKAPLFLWPKPGDYYHSRQIADS